MINYNQVVDSFHFFSIYFSPFINTVVYSPTTFHFQDDDDDDVENPFSYRIGIKDKSQEEDDDHVSSLPFEWFGPIMVLNGWGL